MKIKKSRKLLCLILAVVTVITAVTIAFGHRHSYCEELPIGKNSKGYAFVKICDKCGKNKFKYYDSLLTFVDDDGKTQAMKHWERIIDETNIKISAAIIPSKIEEKTDYDTWYSYAGWDLIKKMQSKGVEFVNHTYTHQNLTKFTVDELHHDFQKAKSILKKHNIKNNILVYPNNAYNNLIVSVADDYFDKAFTCRGKINKNTDNYSLHRVDINDKKVLKKIEFKPQGIIECAGIKSFDKLSKEMTKAVDSRGWLVYMTHAYDSPGGKYYFDEESEKTIIDFCRYVQEKENIKIVTLSEGIAASKEISIKTNQLNAESESDSKKVIYEKTDDPLTEEKMKAIPIANNDMSGDKLRQICVDYLKLSVSCQWVADDTYYLTKKKNPEQYFTEGKLYGGIPYVHKSSGNLYRFMEYYDSKTGVLNSEGLRADPVLFSSACSGTVAWAWTRVVNSADITWTHSLNAAHGLIPVGPYKYDFSIEQFWENDENGEKIYYCNTLDVCKKNTTQVMYESYALSHMADCYTRNGHVAMAISEPVVVRDKNGKIDGAKSYIMLGEQGQYTKAESHVRVTSDGTEYRIRGNDGKKVSFATLFKEGFLVHTFKEFIGEDTVEAGKIKLGVKGKTVTVDTLASKNVKANYPISDIFTIVKNDDGEEVFKHVYRTVEYFTKSVAAKECLPIKELYQYQNGDHTIEIKAQISNGGLITVYSGRLVR